VISHATAAIKTARLAKKRYTHTALRRELTPWGGPSEVKNPKQEAAAIRKAHPKVISAAKYFERGDGGFAGEKFISFGMSYCRPR
jgi:hypothetical protein